MHSLRRWRRYAAPAKLNLTLEVVGKRPDGYHDIRSVVLRLSRLADVVRIRIDDGGGGIVIHTSSTDIPADESNICHVAARRYLEHTRRSARVEIAIDKAVPVAAGLGGGSSDAAAVLVAMNRHFGDVVSPRRLLALSADIGKDVPFFVNGAHACLARGTGEILRTVPAIGRASYLIVNPGVPVATQEAYGALSAELWFMSARDRVDRSAAIVRAMASGELDAVAACLYNDFEVYVERRHPVVKEIKQALLAFGARGAAMSGSGPTVFGLFASTKALAVAESALARRYPAFTVTRG